MSLASLAVLSVLVGCTHKPRLSEDIPGKCESAKLAKLPGLRWLATEAFVWLAVCFQDAII